MDKLFEGLKARLRKAKKASSGEALTRSREALRQHYERSNKEDVTIPEGVIMNTNILEEIVEKFLTEVKHIGFKKAAAKAAASAGVSKERGAAIIAASARKASAAAKRKNPRLKKVRGK